MTKKQENDVTDNEEEDNERKEDNEREDNERKDEARKEKTNRKRNGLDDGLSRHYLIAGPRKPTKMSKSVDKA